MKAYIKSNMIIWARNRQGLGEEDLARMIPVKPEQVSAWETGNDLPTLRQAEKIANVLHIPLGWLYLDTPPDDTAALPDLRTVSDAERVELSPAFKEQLNDVLFKQQEYADLIMEDGAEALPFVGKFSITDSVEAVVRDIRTTLGVDDQMRQQAGGWEAFLREFISRAEEAGILVMRSGIVGNNTHRPLSVAEFRGFAISHAFAPVVFINGRDAKAAQIFTLAHELAHLWIGESGVSNPALDAKGERPNRIEAFCNQIAAELLVPAAELGTRWIRNRLPLDNMDNAKRYFCVSSLVILYRAKTLNLIDHTTFDSLFRQEMSYHEKTATGSGGPPPYITIPARNSHLLTDTILAAAYEGRFLFRDACRVLGAKMQTLHALALETGVL